MSKKETFYKHIVEGNTCKGDFITFGSAMLDGETITNAFVNIPLKTINRHGLIAGATGTGKTKTLQVFAEHLSDKGIPVLLMDIKGDLSGLAQPGTTNDFIKNRHTMIGLPFEAKGFPVEIFTLSEQNGVRLRATVSEFGPVLLSRILDVSETQSGIISVVFKYCDDHKLPLLDLKDFKKILQYATQEGKEEFEADYGRISTASTGAILRKVVELEQQGADLFFGETSFDTDDLLRVDNNGKGYINIIRLTDIQDRPKLFSTFMLSLLAEIYSTFPEQGDSDRPELVIFIDEAHLIFNEASKTLLNQIESIIKLIRSKGVGIYFVTQNPTDVPQAVLGQLGLKVQHALRTFTANDRKAIKLTAQNYPDSDYYNTEKVLTSLGTGEALITALNEKGIPTPLAAVMMRAPMSRMDILTDVELLELLTKSRLAKKYNEVVDRKSAYEMLNSKIEKAQTKIAKEKAQKELEDLKKAQSKQRTKTTTRRSTAMNPVVKVLTSATFIRSVFGIISRTMKK